MVDVLLSRHMSFYEYPPLRLTPASLAWRRLQVLTLGSLAVGFWLLPSYAMSSPHRPQLTAAHAFQSILNHAELFWV